MARITSGKEVDDAQNLTRKTDQHEQDIEGLTGRVDTLEAKISDTNKFADFMSEAMEKSKVMDRLFVKMLCDLMGTNDELKTALKKQITETDREYVRMMFKRFGGWVGAIILVAVGAVIKESIQIVSSWLAHK